MTGSGSKRTGCLGPSPLRGPSSSKMILMAFEVPPGKVDVET